MTVPSAESYASPRPLTEAELYRRILKIARTAALGLDPEQANADDVAQDVALKCFILNERRSVDLAGMPAHELEAYVSRLAGRAALHGFRTVDRVARRDAEFARERTASVYEWCRPDACADAALYDGALEDTLANLGLRTRRIFRTVRDGGFSHAEAAEHLGISASSVSRHMLIARKAFEATLDRLELPYEQRLRSRKPKLLVDDTKERVAPAHVRPGETNVMTAQVGERFAQSNALTCQADEQPPVVNEKARELGEPAHERTRRARSPKKRGPEAAALAREAERGAAPVKAVSLHASSDVRDVQSNPAETDETRRDLALGSGEQAALACESDSTRGQASAHLVHTSRSQGEQKATPASSNALSPRLSPIKDEST